jgi:glycyl-tRNA synthetase beta chain
VADRVDTICGCFLAGFIPTGSQDPYALRRLANGLIRIVSDEPGIHLDELVDHTAALYVGGGFATQESADGTRDALVDFFRARCEAYLKDNNVPYDVANAVKPLSWTQPGVALDRSREITRLRGDARFERLITGVKRVGNILAADHRLMGVDWGRIHSALEGTADLADGIGFSQDLFQDPAEGVLLDALRRAAPKIAEFEQRQDVAEVLNALSALSDPIDAYFDSVLVNCEDSAARTNRHGFLATVYALFARYADFSEIVEEESVDSRP